MQNARMLRDTQEALFAARKATGEISQQGWQAMLKNIGATGYIGLSHGDVVRTTGNIDESTSQALTTGNYLVSEDQHTIRIPIVTRGYTIGMLRLTKPPHTDPWTPEEISDVESLSDQISSTLDSARLYNESQQRAAREQTIGEITTSISAATEIDDIIRETVTQLGEALQDSDVTLRINTQWD
jgi:GAF domain-containing protein